MTKSAITLLLSPSLFFAVLAFAGYLASQLVQDKTKEDRDRQKFETFVTNVKSGKWQLTTDRKWPRDKSRKWLEGMRREHAIGEASQAACSEAAEMYKGCMWTALGGMVFQAVAGFTVLRRMRKAIPNSAPEPTAVGPLPG
jgi:hypothetical protein